MGRFIRLRRPIPRRSTFDNVTDIDLVTLHPAGRDNAIEELAGRSHKRLPLGVFVRARSFADEA
jgi:hypothetical protein